MSNAKPQEFTINGHKYSTIPFTTMEGTPIALEIWGLAAGPIAALLPQLAQLEGIDGESDLAELFSQIDLSSAGKDLGSVFHALAKHPELVHRCFEKTTRDGKDLSAEHNYDVFGAEGLWNEWLAALKEIVRRNGWLLFFGTLAE